VTATARVWWATPADASSDLFRYLDGDERRRHASYRRSEDRARFLVGCALAKTLVARAVGAEPETIRFDRSCPWCGKLHGKPRLPGGGVAFSVSHSGELVGVALSPEAPVGLDVERVREAAVVEAALAPVEAAAVADAADPARAFAVCWTRKEAATKAVGAGLRLEPGDVVVSAPGERARLLSWPAPPRPEEVTLFDLAARPDHVAALAVLGRCDGVVESDGSPLLRLLAGTSSRGSSPPR
jgi:4'-phosphopantetheinyl transferase